MFLAISIIGCLAWASYHQIDFCQSQVIEMKYQKFVFDYNDTVTIEVIGRAENLVMTISTV